MQNMFKPITIIKNHTITVQNFFCARDFLMA